MMGPLPFPLPFLSWPLVNPTAKMATKGGQSVFQRFIMKPLLIRYFISMSEPWRFLRETDEKSGQGFLLIFSKQYELVFSEKLVFIETSFGVDGLAHHVNICRRKSSFRVGISGVEDLFSSEHSPSAGQMYQETCKELTWSNCKINK